MATFGRLGCRNVALAQRGSKRKRPGRGDAISLPYHAADITLSDAAPSGRVRWPFAGDWAGGISSGGTLVPRTFPTLWDGACTASAPTSSCYARLLSGLRGSPKACLPKL
jgi:hypothetical protein